MERFAFLIVMFVFTSSCKSSGKKESETKNANDVDDSELAVHGRGCFDFKTGGPKSVGPVAMRGPATIICYSWKDRSGSIPRQNIQLFDRKGMMKSFGGHWNGDRTPHTLEFNRTIQLDNLEFTQHKEDDPDKTVVTFSVPDGQTGTVSFSHPSLKESINTYQIKLQTNK